MPCNTIEMDDWLKIPPRRRGIPVWRLCVMMGVTLLTLWVSAPVVFALAEQAG